MAESANRPKDLFLKALDLPSPAERAAFLAQECGSDEALRRQIEAMLQAHATPDSFLEKPAVELGATVDAVPVPEKDHAAGEKPSAEGPSTRVGPYKLLQKLGEGGMGVVFLAEQQEPVRRMIALKIIKQGMDSAQIVARFESERQALALMDHPNIAKVLDAGTTDSGRPYFVMELIKGISITKFCDQEHLTPRERLELFIPVCQAVQHAHQKGIIHRDLKPSNVLIALYDGKPIPKVIDFGVAKATSQKLTERTLFTEVGSMVGTLEYMAPEQAELNNLDIDTRADIYALGVLMYELLTGSPPFSAKELRSAAFTEMLRIIREVEPPRPSTKLSSSHDLPAIASHRKLEPSNLTRQVQGDLDWIVMKCLEKERGRRYETANAVALDLQRYLTDEPVQAGPPNAGYRLRKFVKRNRGPVLAASLVLLVLVAGVIGTTVGMWQAVAARNDEAHQRQTAETQRNRAIAAENDANDRAEELKRKQQDLRRTLYASDMTLAPAAWQMGHRDTLEELLDRHHPKPGDDELRKFEWHYWHRLCHCDLRTIPITGLVFNVAWSPDGKHLACLVKNMDARWQVLLFDAITGQFLNAIENPPAKIPPPFTSVSRQLAFSPCGKRLLSLVGTINRDIHVWEVATGRSLFTLATKEEAIFREAMFSPDGRYLATTHDKNATEDVLTLFDAANGKLLYSCAIPQRLDNKPVFSPDGDKVLIAENRIVPVNKKASFKVKIAVCEAKTGKAIFTLDPAFAGGEQFIKDAAWLPTGEIALLLDKGVLQFLDAADGREVRKISLGHGKERSSRKMVFSRDGKRLGVDTSANKWWLTIDTADSVEVWDIPSEKLIRTVRNTSLGQLSPDGTQLATLVNHVLKGNQIKIWDAQQDPDYVLRKLPTSPGKIRAIHNHISSDGKYLASSRGDATDIYVAETGRRVFTFPEIGKGFSPDDRVFVTAKLYGNAKLWDLQSGGEITHLPKDFRLFAFGDDGKSLVGYRGKAIKILAMANGNEKLHLPVRMDDQESQLDDSRWDLTSPALALSPNSRHIARLALTPTGGMHGTLEVYDAGTGQLRWKEPFIRSFRFTLDSQYLILSGGTNALLVYEVRSGKRVRVLKGHRFEIAAVALSPDGARVAACDSSRTARLWDLASGRELLALNCETKTDFEGTLAFSVDGLQLIALSANEFCKWDARPFQIGK